MHFHLSKHQRINLAFIILLTIFTLSFIWGFHLQQENNKDIDRFYRISNWYVSRMLYRSESFLHKAQLYQVDAITLTELNQSYDLLWSRLQIYLESSEIEYLRTQHPEATSAVQTMFNSIKSLSNDISNPKQLQNEHFSQELQLIEEQLKVLNYTFSQVIRGTISQGIRDNNRLIQYWQFSIFLISLILATALLVMTQRASKLAKTDPLTQLGNRRALSEYIKKQLQYSRSVTIYAMDLKKFKLINDQVGYQVGDQVLAAFAKRMTQFKNCTPFRLGGDEFVLVCKYFNDQGDVKSKAQKIKQQMNFNFRSKEHHIPVTVRLGITMSSKNNKCSDTELLDQAIHALNQCKQYPYSDCVLYSDTTHALQKDRLKLEEITAWLAKPSLPCPLLISLKPLYKHNEQNAQIMQINLTWVIDSSSCPFNWLIEQRIYQQAIPSILKLAYQLTDLPVLIKLKFPYHLEQLLKADTELCHLTQQVIFELPNLKSLNNTLLTALKSHQIPIALEHIHYEEYINSSIFEYLYYWHPIKLPSDSKKQQALFQLADAFDLVVLYQSK